MQATRGTSLTGTHRPDHLQHPRRIGTLVATSASVFAADLVSKVAVVATLEGHRPVHVVDGVLTLEVARNPGAAFSIGTGATWLFTAVAVAVVVVIARTARRLRSRPWALALGLLLGGALGNLLDRLARSPGFPSGHVVDWVKLPHWPLFNVADSAIVVGGVLAVLLGMWGRGLDGYPEPRSDPEPSTDPEQPVGQRPTEPSAEEDVQ